MCDFDLDLCVVYCTLTTLVCSDAIKLDFIKKVPQHLLLGSPVSPASTGLQVNSLVLI